VPQRFAQRDQRFGMRRADLGVHIGMGADARGAVPQEFARQLRALPRGIEAEDAALRALGLDAVDQPRPDLVAPPPHAPQRLVQMRVAFDERG
jgi:hypothetical protein